MFVVMMSNMDKEQVKVIIHKYGEVEKYKEEFVTNTGSEEAAMETAKSTNLSQIMKSYQNRTHEIYKKLSLLQNEDINSFEIKKLIGE